MNKLSLNSFIQKYHLGGNVNSVKWVSDGTKLSTRFISGDKSLLGELSLGKQKLPEFEVGVYDTTLLFKMLSTLSDSVEFKVNEVDGEPVNFNFSDSALSVDYVLAATGVIPDVPEMKKMPEFGTLLKLDSQFINSFIKGKAALSDVETFAITPVKGGVEITIGYSDMNSNRISIAVQSGAVDLENPVIFNADLFKEVLSANKECSKATLNVSAKGLAFVEFKIDDFVAKYYLVSQQTS